jgi:subtilisin-like proprotein convertase family protein
VGIGRSIAMYCAFSMRSAHMSGERLAGAWKLTVITCAQQHQQSASEGVAGEFEV